VNITGRTKQIIEAYLKGYPEGKTSKEIAKSLGITPRVMQKHLAKARREGIDIPSNTNETKSKRGLYSVEVGQREGFSINASSTLVKHTTEGSEVVLEWIKQSATAKNMEEFVNGLKERVEGRAKKIIAPKFKDTNKSLWIPMGDPHFGMYAWAKETGEDYDVEIATRTHLSALNKIINSRKNYDQITIISLGDLLHADNRRQVTEKSGHLLDVDGRYRRVIGYVREALCSAIEMAAKRTKLVRVILLDGNHDPHSSGHVSDYLAAYYRKSSHISIDTRVSKHRYEVYGNNLIGLVHGDTTKSLSSLPGVMSCDMREEWGKTANHYWYTGHIHQQKVFEYPACTVESFNSMTTKDSYAADYGYRSRRQMTGIIIDKDHGEIERIMVRPEHFE
jgi:transposase